MGQTAMAPAGGVVGRAIGGVRNLSENGPGVLYYGVNAADRGLGYVGSYMTLGGFVPSMEDDLGGFWAADLRGHLSEYGGFFSNIGMVRKQFIGGTLLGVGLYWDYDGDQNQYSSTVIPTVGAPIVFPGGQVYNQVGISGEWLTDYGNLRSNGYIPVGTTAQLIGPFAGNSLLCVNGINAALGGADLEVGAYIPGLADWAGMISVGGYALGNTRYQFAGGGNAVPWFGGVYTRLDMTFIENWDFSLQANNDSYFDWTGFARLTYRMGGSRRRNVSDQVEQPMMRNEHIVRAHQAPVVATNPGNVDAAGNALPWQLFHVDNSASPGGTGTAEAPFQTLEAAQAAALAEWDIVYVRVGNSLTNPYLTQVDGYSFANQNQFLIGEGSTLRLPTVTCGPRSLLATNSPGIYPVITNPVGVAINVDQPGTTVDHFRIRNANVGISDGAGFAAPGVATVSDVIIQGSDGPFQRGVEIANSTGEFRFDNVRLENLGNDGFVVSAAGGNVSISNNSSLTDVRGTGVLASGDNATVTITNTAFTRIDGTAVAATGTDASVTVNDAQITDTQGIIGQAIAADGTRSAVTLNRTVITNTSGSALVASGTDARITANGSTVRVTGDPGVAISGTGASVLLDASTVADVAGTGVVVTAPGAIFQMQNRSLLDNVDANGIELRDPDSIAYVLGNSSITRITGDGILSEGASLLLQESSISTVRGAGIRAFGANADKVVLVQGGTISNAQQGGIVVTNSNLRVERLIPNDPRTRASVIRNTGPVGIQATLAAGPSGQMNVLVDAAQISQVTTGINVAADAGPTIPNPDPPPPVQIPTNVINFTATNNQISVNPAGIGIGISAVFDTDLEPPLPGTAVSRVEADIRGNFIGGGGGRTPILLSTVGGPTQDNLGIFGFVFANPLQRPLWVRAGGQAALQNLNNGAAVTEVPAPGGAIQTSVNYNPAIAPNLPPPPPPLVPPPIP